MPTRREVELTEFNNADQFYDCEGCRTSLILGGGPHTRSTHVLQGLTVLTWQSQPWGQRFVCDEHATLVHERFVQPATSRPTVTVRYMEASLRQEDYARLANAGRSICEHRGHDEESVPTWPVAAISDEGLAAHPDSVGLVCAEHYAEGYEVFILDRPIHFPPHVEFPDLPPMTGPERRAQENDARRAAFHAALASVVPPEISSAEFDEGESMPISTRTIPVSRIVVAELVRRLGGVVEINERDIVTFPAAARLTITERDGMAPMRLRVTGAAMMPTPGVPGQPSREVRTTLHVIVDPAPALAPIKDEELTRFPTGWVTCPECKFSFEKYMGTECHVCKLQEIEGGGTSTRVQDLETELGRKVLAISDIQGKLSAAKTTIDIKAAKVSVLESKCRLQENDIDGLKAEIMALKRNLKPAIVAKPVLRAEAPDNRGNAFEATALIKAELARRDPEPGLKFSERGGGLRRFFEPILAAMGGSVQHHDMKSFSNGVERHVFAFDVPVSYQTPAMTVAPNREIDAAFGVEETRTAPPSVSTPDPETEGTEMPF